MRRLLVFSSIMSLSSAVLLTAGLIYLSACATTQTPKASEAALTVSDALTQAQGAAKALGTLADDMPVDAGAKARIKAAASTIEAATGDASDAAKSVSAGDVAGALNSVQAVIETVTPSSTSAQMANWLSWAGVALKAGGILATLVSGS